MVKMQIHKPKQKSPKTARLVVRGDIVKIGEICSSLSCLTGAKPLVVCVSHRCSQTKQTSPKKEKIRKKKLACSSEAGSKQQHLHLATASYEG